MKKLFLFTLLISLNSISYANEDSSTGATTQLTSEAEFTKKDILVPELKPGLDTGRICDISTESDLYFTAPDNFVKSNNLRHKAGSPLYAKGEILIIEGLLQDSHCVPISNAKVELWHANHLGNYQNAFDKTKSDLDVDPNFAGSGITYTNNLGKFFFTTIMPGNSSDGNKYLNITINHDLYQPFSSSYIINQNNNDSDNDNDSDFITKKNENNTKLEFIITIPYVNTTKLY